MSDLLPKLIAQYEMQAQLRRQIELDNQHRSQRKPPRASVQTTFGW